MTTEGTENQIDEKKLFSNSVELEEGDTGSGSGDGSGDAEKEKAEQERAAAELLEKQKTEQADSIDEYWGELKNVFGEGYELPEVITKGVNDKGEKVTAKEKLQLLQRTLLDSTTFGANEDDDAFVRSYMQESVKENFSREKFIESYFNKNNLLNLPPEKFMFEVYKNEYGISDKNPDGMTDEQISSYVEKKDPLELKAESIRIKKGFAENQKAETQRKELEYREKFVSDVLKNEESNTKIITSYIDTVKNARSISGFEFGEADRQEFIKELPEFVKKKVYQKENGELLAYSKAEELLASLTSDPEKEMELIPLLWMLSKDKVKGYTTQLKERAKEIAEGKLSGSRKEYSGNSTGVSDVIDEDALFSRE